MEEQLKSLIEPLVTGLGCELWGIEYVQHGRTSSLKVFIESPDGVDVEDCARVSRQVSSMLDVEEPVKGEYNLEVSSPGLDRRLFTRDQFEAYVGVKVAVKLYKQFEGRKRYTGLLCGVENDDVVIRVDDEEYLLPMEQIHKAHVVPEFDKG